MDISKSFFSFFLSSFQFHVCVHKIWMHETLYVNISIGIDLIWVNTKWNVNWSILTTERFREKESESEYYLAKCCWKVALNKIRHWQWFHQLWQLHLAIEIHFIHHNEPPIRCWYFKLFFYFISVDLREQILKLAPNRVQVSNQCVWRRKIN